MFRRRSCAASTPTRRSTADDEPEERGERAGLIARDDEAANVGGADDDAADPRLRHVGSFQLRFGEDCALQVAIDERDAAEIGAGEVRFAELTAFEDDARAAKTDERRVVELTAAHTHVLEDRFDELRAGHSATAESDAREARAAQIGNCFNNQFQLPLLFYVLVAIALPLRRADLVFVMLSWVFVVTRFAHAGIFVTSNDVRQRSLAWFAGVLVLMAMWLYFALRLLLLL